MIRPCSIALVTSSGRCRPKWPGLDAPGLVRGPRPSRARTAAPKSGHRDVAAPAPVARDGDRGPRTEPSARPGAIPAALTPAPQMMATPQLAIRAGAHRRVRVVEDVAGQSPTGGPRTPPPVGRCRPVSRRRRGSRPPAPRAGRPARARPRPGRRRPTPRADPRRSPGPPADARRCRPGPRRGAARRRATRATSVFEFPPSTPRTNDRPASVTRRAARHPHEDRPGVPQPRHDRGECLGGRVRPAVEQDDGAVTVGDGPGHDVLGQPCDRRDRPASPRRRRPSPRRGSRPRRSRPGRADRPSRPRTGSGTTGRGSGPTASRMARLRIAQVLGDAGIGEQRHPGVVVRVTADRCRLVPIRRRRLRVGLRPATLHEQCRGHVLAVEGIEQPIGPAAVGSGDPGCSMSKVSATRQAVTCPPR